MSMIFLDDVSLPGHGKISSACWSQDRRILAVTSTFRLLTEPPARAAYGGQKLRYRLALYRPPSRRPIAVFDHAILPINDVAFHPTKTVVAVGGGSYDGGYMFQGQISLWDWTLSWSKSFCPIPEVTGLRFSQGGNEIEAIVRPWDDGAGETQLDDPTDAFYRVTLDQVFTRAWDRLTENVVNDQMVNQPPLTSRKVATMANFGRPKADPVAVIEDAFGLDRLRWRSPIWDTALIGSDAIGIVHDDCQLEMFGRDGEQHRSFKGRGHGAQIFRSPEPLIHSVHLDQSENWWTAHGATLLRLHDGQLNEVVSLPGRYSFSMAQNGSLLGRRDRSYQKERGSEAADVIVSADLRKVTHYDFGHYDVFNHYIRVDGAPEFFVVQGTPPGSHKDKYLCRATTEGRVERLWPLWNNVGDRAGHVMECCFCYIRDQHGPGMIVAGRHHNPMPSAPYTGFIYRKTLDGRELWRHSTSASATSIKLVPNSDLLVVAFLDGNLALLHSPSGAIARWQPFTLDDHPGLIVSLDIDITHISFGSIDGRCAVMPLPTFLKNQVG